jgi:hypothetical protein
MKIKSITSNASTWYDLENQVEIKNDNGVKSCSRFYFNGFENVYSISIENLTDESSVVFRCTGNHQLRDIEGEWIRADELFVGCKLDNNTIITDIELSENKVPTMDMEVPDDHYYELENGVASHNTALIMGGVSEGINPDPAMTYTQLTAAGEVDRINPTLLNLMKERDIYNERYVQEVVDAHGSVQNVKWLSASEKEVFKTAFEINQKTIIDLAAARQMYIDQSQSLNLFFSSEEDEGYIAEVHQYAFKNPMIMSLYYCYSKAGVVGSKDSECIACQ